MDQLQEAVQQLGRDVAATQSAQAVTAANSSWMKDSLNRIEIAIKPMESLERRVSLLERAIFGLITVVVVAVAGALINMVVTGGGHP